MESHDNLQMLFDQNKIDSRHFNLDAFSIEAKVIKNKINDVKARNPLLSHEPIFSHNQKRGGSGR